MVVDANKFRKNLKEKMLSEKSGYILPIRKLTFQKFNGGGSVS